MSKLKKQHRIHLDLHIRPKLRHRYTNVLYRRPYTPVKHRPLKIYDSFRNSRYQYAPLRPRIWILTGKKHKRYGPDGCDLNNKGTLGRRQANGEIQLGSALSCQSNKSWDTKDWGLWFCIYLAFGRVTKKWGSMEGIHG